MKTWPKHNDAYEFYVLLWIDSFDFNIVAANQVSQAIETKKGETLVVMCCSQRYTYHIVEVIAILNRIIWKPAILISFQHVHVQVILFTNEELQFNSFKGCKTVQLIIVTMLL